MSGWSFMRTSYHTAKPWIQDPMYSQLASYINPGTGTVIQQPAQKWRNFIAPSAFLAVTIAYRCGYKNALDNYMNSPGTFVVRDDKIPLPLPAGQYYGQSFIPCSLKPIAGQKEWTDKTYAAFAAKIDKAAQQHKL